MRYRESREQSAELLRAAIARMGHHSAAFNPWSYAVWYEYVAGINTRLNQALDACLNATPRLDDAAILRMHAEYVAGADEAAVQRTSGELQRLMSGMAASAQSTGQQAATFGEQLGGLTDALLGSAAEHLGPMIDDVVAGTKDMRHAVSALHLQISAGHAEIERLRSDLQRARDEALIDPLTQLLNRKGLDVELQKMLQQPPQPGRAHSLIMIDIDCFKAVNDTYGHTMGDRVLQLVAQVLRSGATGLLRVARYGGEEFALLLPQATPATATAEAEAMRLRVKAARVTDRRTKNVVLRVTASAGVALWQPGEDAASLIARADAALYAAKHGGRDRVSTAPSPEPLSEPSLRHRGARLLESNVSQDTTDRP